MWRRIARNFARWTLVRLAVASIVVLVLSRWFRVDLPLNPWSSLLVEAGAVEFVSWPGPNWDASHFSPTLNVSIIPADWYHGMTWRYSRTWHASYRRLAIPIWWLFGATTAGAAVSWWGPMRTAARRRRAACVGCGYSRCGLAPDAPCPECGKVPAV